MFENLTEVKREKPMVFQVLLLNNDGDQVEVQESEHVDFVTVHRHLKSGGSVFITSKDEQKIVFSKKKPRRNAKNTGWVTAFYFNPA